MNAFSYTRAATSADVVDQLRAPGRRTQILAGGMDLLDLLKEGLATPDVLVSLADLASLKGLSTDAAGRLIVGARTTLAELAAHADLEARYPALAHAAGKAATPQIRNRATLAGNLLQRPRCWYFRNGDIPCLKKGGDACPGQTGENRYLAVFGGGPCFAVHASSPATALVALNASVLILGPDGAEERPIEELFVLPGEDPTREHTLGADELILGLALPAPATGAGSAYQKVRHKEAYDWAMAEVGVWLRVSSGVVQACRIALGGVANVPWRAHYAEQWLIGKSPTDALVSEAARRATSGATPLSDNAYKLPAVQHVTELALKEAIDMAEGGL